MSTAAGAVQEVARILDRAAAGRRLTEAEALVLYEAAELGPLGEAADAVRARVHPEGLVTYVIDRNINYTNICNAYCSFCVFYRPKGHPEGYVLTHEQIFEKIAELKAVGGTEVLMQGGIHPDLTIEFYEALLRAIKARFDIHLHAFSPPEIDYIAKVSNLSLAETLARLKAAGLDSIPGGGAEILVDRVRESISRLKIRSEPWLAVMREAHRQGIPSTATMMYGTVETPAEVIAHLGKIRALQDETGGFTAFIAWNFQPAGTPLARARGSRLRRLPDDHYLRTVAVARLFLDNVRNLQASYVTQGKAVAQRALRFGVNDMGGTMMEENVVSAAGTKHLMAIEELVQLIRDAGFRPAQRNTRYEILRIH
ncbi:MAG TPA: cyclic dehypoxanthinyl futalosine synthase [Thermodesulfobacteriota bacterium]|nr:cyclic dehypoxanthinyl futalosine synthase [Thermodesulfobacteriota bacterium]